MRNINFLPKKNEDQYPPKLFDSYHGYWHYNLLIDLCYTQLSINTVLSVTAIITRKSFSVAIEITLKALASPPKSPQKRHRIFHPDTTQRHHISRSPLGVSPFQTDQRFLFILTILLRHCNSPNWFHNHHWFHSIFLRARIKRLHWDLTNVFYCLRWFFSDTVIHPWHQQSL